MSRSGFSSHGRPIYHLIFEFLSLYIRNLCETINGIYQNIGFSKKNPEMNVLHWVWISMSSVTTSTGSQQVDFVAPKSLAAMLKSSARPAYNEQFLLLLFAGCKLDQCIIIFTIFYHLTFHTIDLQIYNVHLPQKKSLKIVFSVSEKNILSKERLLLPRVE